MWGSSVECFKYPLVAWEKVCLPHELGGLGIRNLAFFNQALLGKWLWRYGHEITHLWRRVIAMKYEEGKGVGALEFAEGLMVVVYGGVLMKGGKVLSFVVGDGSRILIPYFISSKLGILGVMRVTGFVGVLMEVGSLTFSLFIIRFEMQFLPLSLGRVFGKSRFLKGWHFLCGQQLMVRF